MEDKNMTALGKAAHAVVAHVSGLPIKQITITASKNNSEKSKGSVEIDGLRDPGKAEDVGKFILMSLAKVTAERLMQRGAPDDLVASISQKPDWEKCRDALTSLGFNNVDKVLRNVTIKILVPILLNAWPAIQAIADTLVQEKKISGKKVAQILESIPLVKIV